jgi:hypothetical protein
MLSFGPPLGTISSMATRQDNELARFHDFVGQQLAGGGKLSPEEALDLWRAAHPQSEEFRESVQAVKDALDDMDAGDTGEPFDEFMRELRRSRGLST